MIQKRVLSVILLVAVSLGIVSALGVAAPRPLALAQAAPLQNPGFEGISCRAGSVSPECLDNWTHATHDGSNPQDVYTPQGWVTWWSGASGTGRPRVDTIANVPPFTGELPRIRSGYYAMRMMPAATWVAMDAGVYQVVTGLTPGATVQFSAYAHGWSCDNDAKIGYTCADPWNMSFQVGIEPNGATGAPAAGVIWSPEQWIADHYALVGPVTAQVGAGGTIAVYLRVKTKWPYVHQEAYWDDTSLVYTAQPAAAPTTAPGVPAGQPTVIAGSDGLNIRSGPGTNFAILAHVDPGTQLKVTGKYADWWQVDYSGTAAWVYSGVVTAQNTANVPQVVPPASPVPPAPTSAPPTATLPPPTPTLSSELPTSEAGSAPSATTVATGASICVLAYHDRNGDTFRNDAATEELLPNAEITVADASGVIARYTTNGIAEPYCFTVAAGNYRVIQTPPAGYMPSGAAEQTVGVVDGSSLSLQFGDVRGEGPVATEAAAATAVSGGGGGASGSSTIRIFSTVAKVSGVLVLIVAVGLAVLFVFSRRRR
jgi:hypothetical protein